MSTPAVKVTLGSKKVVILKQPEIRDQENAMAIAAPLSKDQPMILVMKSQKELLKLLLIEIDGKKVSRQDAEQLDSLFTLPEYNQLSRFVSKLAGGDDMGESLSEIVTSGDK